MYIKLSLKCHIKYRITVCAHVSYTLYKSLASTSMHLVEVSCKSNQELGWGKLGEAGIGVKVQKIRLKLGERGLLAKYQICSRDVLCRY